MACSSEGSTDDSGTLTDAGTDAAAFGSSACYGCVKTQCSSERSECLGDPGCAAWLGCVESCPLDAAGNAEPACVTECPSPTGSVGALAKTKLDACRTTATCASCGVGPDSGGENPVLQQQCAPSTLSDLCTRCQYEKCCDSVDAINPGGVASELASCWYECDDTPCMMDCYAKYPEAVPAFGGYDACVFVHCGGTGLCKASACTTCLGSKCPETLADCLTDTGCYLTRECMGGCATGSCAEQCIATYSFGSKHWEPYMACVTQHCALECSK